MSKKPKARHVVAVFRRWSGELTAGHDTIVVPLHDGHCGVRSIYRMADGTVRRSHWEVLSRQRTINQLARESRMQLWDGRRGMAKLSVNSAVDFVPKFGIIELDEGVAAGTFDQKERRAAMQVYETGVDTMNLLMVRGNLTLDEPRFDDRMTAIFDSLTDPKVLEHPLHSSAAPAPKKKRAPRKPVEPLAAEVAVEHGYPEVLIDNRHKYVQLEHGRHYLRKMGATGVLDIDMLRKGRESFSPVLMLGEAGTGKTQTVMAAFGEQNIITVLGHEEVEAASFEGRYVPAEGGGWKLVIGKLVRAMQDGKVLFIDEIGLISSLVLSILYSAMDGRRTLEPTLIPDIGLVKAEPGFYVVGATNPKATGARIADAMRSRFPYRPVVTTDYKMAVTHLGVPEAIASAGANLDERRIARELSWSPQARDLVQFVQAVEDFNEDFALASLAGKAPESDQRTVCEVLSREVGRTVKPLVTA